jgi:acetoin utilization deacetylase AcuC-like enzyme
MPAASAPPAPGGRGARRRPAVVYSDRYAFDIGRHVFPIDKYRRVHAALIGAGALSPADVVEPEPLSWEQLAAVHTGGYLARLRSGLTVAEQAELELPWSPAIVEGFRLMAGGTVLAARLALGLDGDAEPRCVAVHLGGGFHHAFADHGEGFCMFNDVALAIRLLRGAAFERAAIVDGDVHHGNGTARIFQGERSVFTFSVHQIHNYPAAKPASSLDVGLADGALDAEYLHALREALPTVFAFEPQILFYLAGADPYAGDQLGGLCLSKDGLRTRDRIVFEAARRAGVPVVVTLAGGYARLVEDTVDIHVATVEEALAVLAQEPRRGQAAVG